jgi:hypothetical protein
MKSVSKEERFLKRILPSRLVNPAAVTIAVVGLAKRNGGNVAILFSTWVKIGDAAGPHLRKNLEDLLANSSSALRVESVKESGVEVLYIRDRNIFDYLWEKLDAYESQLRSMRTKARVALELQIRPFIQEEVVPGVDALPLWKKIEQRILDDHPSNGKKPFFHSICDCLLGNAKTVDQIASIPDGLTLSQMPQSAFIAGVAFGFDADQISKPKKPVHVGCSYGPMLEWPARARFQRFDALQIKQFYLNALRLYIKNDFHTLSSVVITPTLHPLEKDGELSLEHARGFLMAAREFVKEKKNSIRPVSLLIAAEKAVWYQRLQNEMLKIDSSLPASEKNPANPKQQDIPASPSDFSKTVFEWNRYYGSAQEVAANLAFSDSSDD